MRTNDPAQAFLDGQPTQGDSPWTMIRRWIAPPRPGKGKRAWLAFVLGFLLGPIGIGLYLRSVLDALLLLCVNIVLFTIGGDGITLFTWVVGGVWGFGRVWLDSREPVVTSDNPESPQTTEQSKRHHHRRSEAVHGGPSRSVLALTCLTREPTGCRMSV